MWKQNLLKPPPAAAAAAPAAAAAAAVSRSVPTRVSPCLKNSTSSGLISDTYLRTPTAPLGSEISLAYTRVHSIAAKARIANLQRGISDEREIKCSEAGWQACPWVWDYSRSECCKLNGIIDNIDRREEHDSHPSVRRVVCNPLRRLAWRHRKPSCGREV